MTSSERLDEAIGVYELNCSGCDWTAVLDERRNAVAFHRNDRKTWIRLNLESFSSFSKTFNSLSRNEKAALRGVVEHWARRHVRLQLRQWIVCLQRLAFYLVQWSVAKKRRHPEPFVYTLLEWLDDQGADAPWLAYFDLKLGYAQRYELLQYARKGLGHQRRSSHEEVWMDLSDPEARQAEWFTALCLFELVCEWVEAVGITAIDVQRAFRSGLVGYLGLLKDEPYQHELNSFLGNLGSSIDDQVKRLLRAEEKSAGAAALEAAAGSRHRRRLDETLHRVFFSWFLRRYDLLSARRLMWHSFSNSDRRWSIVCVTLVLFSVGLFLALTFHWYAAVPWFGGRILSVPPLLIWFVQVGAQLAALLLMTWRVPDLFNLLLPRALFGSLLTWITIIFTSLPGLQAMTLNDDVLHPYTLQMLFHEQLRTNPYSVIVAFPALILALVFVTREVNRFVRGWSKLVVRAVTAILGLYSGSMFWGIIFAMPIKLVMEKQADWDCSCLYRIALIGASLAALFGILVELLWDDKSITEPLEEPL